MVCHTIMFAEGVWSTDLFVGCDSGDETVWRVYILLPDDILEHFCLFILEIKVRACVGMSFAIPCRLLSWCKTVTKLSVFY